ncbi:MAG: ABC transporter substrate-binding protein [Planctomycetes bacterium]|nr:ABC transporter substrate-binding protein [Planctomycetota bacterium]
MSGPRRIVSLVPSTTESVCGLGHGAALVGCTRWCEEPAAQLAQVQRIGGTKNPDREAVLALAPDLVLANAEENRAEDLAWLQQRVPVLVQTPRSVREAAAALRELAQALGDVEAAVPWLLRIEAELAAAEVERLRAAPLRAFYAIWRKPWMSVNADTFVHDALRCSGFANVTAALPVRYPEVDLAAVRALAPDVVLLPSEPWAFTAADRDALQHEGTFGSAVVAVCDGRDFCWHGVRMAEGLGRARRLAAALRCR